jgi:hypothetical protein
LKKYNKYRNCDAGSMWVRGIDCELEGFFIEVGAQACPSADGGAAEADAGEAGHHGAQDYDHVL